VQDDFMPSASRMSRSSVANAGVWARAQARQVADQCRHVSPKGAATTNLVVLLLMTVGVSVWQPSFQLRRPAAADNPLAPAPTAVKMIDAAPRGADCREQTWPYIDKSCLNYGKAETTTPPQPQAGIAAKPVTTGRAPASIPPRIQEMQAAPAVPAAIDAAPPAPPQASRATAAEQPSTDDVQVADDDPAEYAPTEEELRAQARAEARQRSRARHRDFFRHGHFWIGPFRF
jgi:hypothetical protein